MRILGITLVVLLLSGCMTHRGYVLRLTERCSTIDLTDDITRLQCKGAFSGQGNQHGGL